VLLREDGSYLYMLPSVVDDMDMDITHVVRGEDHVTNSAVQVQIFAALGSTGENKTPDFAHFSLLTSAEGEGLSKRGGAQSVRELRDDAGLEPMALLSLLAHIGTSESIEPFVTIDPLVEGFDFAKFARNPARFDPETLDILNARILHATPFDAVRARLGLDEADETFWLAVRGNLKKLSDAEKWWKIIYEPIRPLIGGQNFMIAALVLLPKGEWDENTWKEWTSAVKEETGRKGKDLFMPLRTALTGRHEGPEMKVLLPLIGRERAIERLQGKKR
jgi:glutamyl-tRNA synthetase